jgi:hypothetical protein
LARLVENALKGLVGKIGAKYVEGGFDFRIDQSLLKRRAKRLSPLGIAAQGFRKRPNEAGIAFGSLNFDPDKPTGNHPAAMRGRSLSLGFRRHDRSYCKLRPVISPGIS